MDGRAGMSLIGESLTPMIGGRDVGMRDGRDGERFFVQSALHDHGDGSPEPEPSGDVRNLLDGFDRRAIQLHQNVSGLNARIGGGAVVENLFDENATVTWKIEFVAHATGD